jgi:RNA 3'-terminal phosphate cyclase
MIQLDGNHCEGGGQIVRTALALSAITQKPFEVTDIRKGRPDSGLKSQHLHCIKALEKICGARAEGAELGSQMLKFYPGKIKGGKYDIDIQTAGSITLLLQSLLIPCFFAPKQVTLNIHGGTNTEWAMPIEYFKEVLVPHLRKFCEKIEVKLLKRGYYPKGGGEVEIKIKPKYKLADYSSFDEFWKKINEETENKLRNMNINLTEQGYLIGIKGVSHASKELQNANVAERQAHAAQQVLGKHTNSITLYKEYCDTLSIGTGITLWAIYSKQKDDIDANNPIILGADALGEKGKPAEKVGEEAAHALLKQMQAKTPADPHLVDNLIPWMALFRPSMVKTSEITKHTLTNIYVVEQFLGKMFETDEKVKEIKSR